MILVCDWPLIVKTFRITGLAKAFALYPTLDEAVAAMPGDIPASTER